MEPIQTKLTVKNGMHMADVLGLLELPVRHLITQMKEHVMETHDVHTRQLVAEV